MRQLLSEKNVRKLAKRYNLPIVNVMVRGGTDHRKDLCLEDGSIINLWPDGTMEKSEIGWHKDK
jgi:hypothetical protein